MLAFLNDACTAIGLERVTNTAHQREVIESPLCMMDDCKSYALGQIHLADQTEQLTDLIIEIHLNQVVSTAVLDEMGCQSHMTIGSTRKCWMINACTPQHYKCHSHVHKICDTHFQ